MLIMRHLYITVRQKITNYRTVKREGINNSSHTKNAHEDINTKSLALSVKRFTDSIGI